jgi:hypothetical protein
MHVQVHAELTLEVPVEHGLMMENLLDLAHAPFTHTSTFAKGWPVPDVVRFNAQRLLGGNWEPYPIDMSFEPPCMVLSTIGKPTRNLLAHVRMVRYKTPCPTASHRKEILHQQRSLNNSQCSRSPLMFSLGWNFPRLNM